MITAVNNTAENVYVQKLTLNGKEVPLSHPFLLHSGMLVLYIINCMEYVFSQVKFSYVI